MPINYRKTYDKLGFEERIEFRDLTIKAILEIYPHYVVRPLDANNPDAIFIGNQQDNVRVQFPLRDLYARFVSTAQTKSDLKDEIIKCHAPILKMVEDAELIEDTSKLTWSDVKDFVNPRFSRKDEFPNLEDTVHFPFGEDLVTIFLIDNPSDGGLVTRIGHEMLDRWEITDKDLYKQALDNLSEKMDGIYLKGTEPPHGYIRTDSSEEYAATAILIGGFRYTVAQNIGSPYRFGVPSRYVMIAWCELEDEEFQTEMRAWMKREFERLPSSLTDKIYEVDDKGEIKQLKDLPEIPEPPDFSNN